MGALQTLRGRILAASLVLALLIGSAFVVLILAVRDTRDAARVAEQSERVAAAANLLERLLLDLESGQRAYVITGRRSFLEPWAAALRRYPLAAQELRTLVVDPAQRRRVDQIRSEMSECIVGGGGADVINGGNGTDVCIGGPGTDTFSNCETQIQ